MNLKWRMGLALLATSVMAAFTGCALVRKDDPGKAGPRLPEGPAADQEDARSRSTKGPFKLGPPVRPRDWEHARLQAAQRLVAANPDDTYMGSPPPMLLAIPVLTIELNSDGSVRHITVMRYPSQARDTVNAAIAAVRKAAPFGDISRLPKPWKFNETFLFNAERKFKPMTLDRQ